MQTTPNYSFLIVRANFYQKSFAHAIITCILEKGFGNFDKKNSKFLNSYCKYSEHLECKTLISIW